MIIIEESVWEACEGHLPQVGRRGVVRSRIFAVELDHCAPRAMGPPVAFQRKVVVNVSGHNAPTSMILACSHGVRCEDNVAQKGTE
jgi:hypothetical protein